MAKQTYGQLWDNYVSESFPRLQQSSDRELTYPGEEWGSEKSWRQIFARLFEASGVEGWKAAIEIGGGGGKYTERVLRSNDDVQVFGFDVSRNFLDATAARLNTFVDGGRLHLDEIDAIEPDHIYKTLEARGLVRQVDAMFSIDAMVHVDLQYLVVYWINAALTLKPGGRILMTLADPTSDSGFQKIRRDIRKFYKFQGRMCPKFEYLSEQIVRQVLGRLGFDIISLAQWSYFENRPARDLYLIAELRRPEEADRFRDAIRADPDASGPPDGGATETFSEMWDRCLDDIVSGRAAGVRPDADRAIEASIPKEMAAGWRKVVEFGGGEVSLTRALLALAPQAELTEVAVSRKAVEAYQALADRAGDGRLRVSQVDPVNPDGLVRLCESAGAVREIDAVISLGVFPHLDLQYVFSYLVSSALVLRRGGLLAFNVGDATTDAGVDKLIADVRRYFPYQGQACPRYEYQSAEIIRHLLTELGFEISTVTNWSADPAGEARDLYVVATLADPDKAESFRTDVSIGLVIPMLQAGAEGSEETGDVKATPKARPAGRGHRPEDQPVARALGQAYWRQLFVQANPDLSKEALKDKLTMAWPDAQREYIHLGHMVLQQLRNRGHQLRKTDADASAAGGAADDNEVARMLGQAYWRQLLIQASPEADKEEIKAKLSESWGGARRDYTRLGRMVLRQLQNTGYAVESAAA